MHEHQTLISSGIKRIQSHWDEATPDNITEIPLHRKLLQCTASLCHQNAAFKHIRSTYFPPSNPTVEQLCGHTLLQINKQRHWQTSVGKNLLKHFWSVSSETFQESLSTYASLCFVPSSACVCSVPHPPVFVLSPHPPLSVLSLILQCLFYFLIRLCLFCSLIRPSLFYSLIRLCLFCPSSACVCTVIRLCLFYSLIRLCLVYSLTRLCLFCPSSACVCSIPSFSCVCPFIRLCLSYSLICLCLFCPFIRLCLFCPLIRLCITTELYSVTECFQFQNSPHI